MSKDFLNFPEDEFSEIYSTYYPKLKRFAKEYILYEEDAENIVQDIFMYLWENADLLNTVLNLNAYLFTLIKHKCIDFLRGQIRWINHPINHTNNPTLFLKVGYRAQNPEQRMIPAYNQNLFCNEGP